MVRTAPAFGLVIKLLTATETGTAFVEVAAGTTAVTGAGAETGAGFKTGSEQLFSTIAERVSGPAYPVEVILFAD